jgi:hypothetical protein
MGGLGGRGGWGGLGGWPGLAGLPGLLCRFLLRCTEVAELPSARISKGADTPITRESNMIMSLFIIQKFLYTKRINNHACMVGKEAGSPHLTGS